MYNPPRGRLCECLWYCFFPREIRRKPNEQDKKWISLSQTPTYILTQFCVVVVELGSSISFFPGFFRPCSSFLLSLSFISLFPPSYSLFASSFCARSLLYNVCLLAALSNLLSVSILLLPLLFLRTTGRHTQQHMHTFIFISLSVSIYKLFPPPYAEPE